MLKISLLLLIEVIIIIYLISWYSEDEVPTLRGRFALMTLNMCFSQNDASWTPKVKLLDLSGQKALVFQH